MCQRHPTNGEPHATADVAVFPLTDTSLFNEVEARVLPHQMCATDAGLAGQDLLGVETYLIGLFEPHPGAAAAANQPVVRFGRLALLNSEEITLSTTFAGVEDSTSTKAFLVDAQSWGGQSGSPAFISYHHVMNVGGRDLINVTRPTLRLLGVVAGHFPVPTELVLNDSSSAHIDLNAGLAVVVPAERILDLLPRPATTAEASAQP